MPAAYVMLEFQFLIGSLESLSNAVGVSFPLEFQFLIGSLESKWIMLLLYSIPMFQFLIGSLESGVAEALKGLGKCFNSL